MPSSPTMPREIGRYQVERVLGRGAMGTVYLAMDPLIQRRVALKTIRADLARGTAGSDISVASADRDGISGGEWAARFINEARAAGRLVHPNIVSVFDYGEVDGVAYIALEYVDGGSLADRLGGGGPRDIGSISEALTWFAQLLDALAYAHELGVIHRDIKPANLLIGARGECKIADFGIAQIDTGRLTAVGMMIGTPSYMSPEQYIGRDIDARSDLFSAGVVLYEMVTGRCPFVGNAAEIMHQVLEKMPPAVSSIVDGLPRALDRMLANALAKRPEDRYASAQSWRVEVIDLIDALSRMDDDRTVVAPLANRVGRGESEHSKGGAHSDANVRSEVNAHEGNALSAGNALREGNVGNAASAVDGVHGEGFATRARSSTGVSESATRFSKDMLADVERRLASHIGPVASLLVKRAVVKSTDARMLAAQLSRHAPDEATRRDIDEALARYVMPDPGTRGSSFTDVRGSGTNLSDAGQSGLDASQSVTQLDTRRTDVVDSAIVEAATRCLAMHIGPVATLIAQRASRGVDRDTFFRKLAAALPSSVDATEFVSQLRALRR